MSLTLSCANGSFLNAREGEGWDLVDLRKEGLLFPKTIYQFSLLRPNPLTWLGVGEFAGYWQPDQHEAETDLGSVPPLSSMFIPRDYTIRSFIFHDSGFGHLGLWWCATQGGVYEFRPLSRWQCNRLLRDQVIAEGCDRVRQQIIFAGVQLGAMARGGRGR